mgnify:FL=1
MRYVPFFVFAGALTLTGCGGGGETSAPATPPANASPVADAGVDMMFQEASDVALDGTGSSDSDGEIAAFSWLQTAGPQVELAEANSAAPTFQAPPVPERTVLTFQLTVTDDDGATDQDSVSITVEPAPRPSRLEFELTVDGAARAYTLYTPRDFTDDADAIVVLHGGSQSMRSILDSNQTPRRWLEIADEQGVLIIAPNGFNALDGDGLGDDQYWNDQRAFDIPEASGEDDVGFILAVIEAALEGRGFNADRVFATGVSNGGSMTFRLLIEATDRFAGGGTFIAGLTEDEVPPPSGPIPIALLNGTEDPINPFDGGSGVEERGPARPVPETVAFWVGANAVGPDPNVTRQLPDTVPDDDCVIEENVYERADGAPAVIFYRAIGGGHTTPDPAAPADTPFLRNIVGNTCKDVEGIDLMFNFFQQQ